MNQALYAHMNNKRKMKKKKISYVALTRKFQKNIKPKYHRVVASFLGEGAWVVF
jgi:hypothetical protein